MEIISGYDFFENPEATHKTFSGALGTMVIHKVLAGAPVTPHVTIWQYRKFVSTTPYGRKSPNLGSTRLVKSPVLAHTVIDNPEVDLADNAFLVHQPSEVGSVSAQYNKHHHILDFLRFAGILIETDVIGEEKILQFFSSRYMVVGGAELGTYPTEWWKTAYSAINRAALLFSERYGPCDPVDPYQKRAIAFLQERLGSYLTVKRLAELTPNILSYPHGYVHTVTDAEVFIGGS